MPTFCFRAKLHACVGGYASGAWQVMRHLRHLWRTLTNSPRHARLAEVCRPCAQSTARRCCPR